MFRRSVVEILLPDSIEIGAYGGDTYFAFGAQAIGGSILVDKHVALYRRHGANGYSDMGIYGAATMAVRTCSSGWEEVAKNLGTHVEKNLSRFHHQIRSDHVERLLDVTAPFGRLEAHPCESSNLVAAPVSVASSARHVLVKRPKLTLSPRVKRTVLGYIRQLGYEVRRIDT